MNHVIEVPCGTLGLTGHAPTGTVLQLGYPVEWHVEYFAHYFSVPDVANSIRAPPALVN